MFAFAVRLRFAFWVGSRTFKLFYRRSLRFGRAYFVFAAVVYACSQAFSSTIWGLR